MTLPVSPNSISMSQINTEIGFGSTVAISMNDIRCRSLAGDGTTISSGVSWNLGAIRGRTFFKYSRAVPTYFWIYNGGLYYNNAYIGAPGTAVSFTAGGYTYYRGAFVETIAEYTGGENGGYVNYDYYRVARA